MRPDDGVRVVVDDNRDVAVPLAITGLVDADSHEAVESFLHVGFELVPAAATVLAITSILPQADGSAVLTARLTSAIDVAFDGSAAFSAVDPRTGATTRPAMTSLAGAEARVVLPPDPATVRLFRLRLE